MLTQPFILVWRGAIYQSTNLWLCRSPRPPLGGLFRPHSTLTFNFSEPSMRFTFSYLAVIPSTSKRVHAIIERQISPELLLGQLPVHVLFGIVFVFHESLE